MLSRVKLSRARLMEVNDRLVCDLRKERERSNRLKLEAARALERAEQLRREGVMLRTAAETALEQYKRLSAEVLDLRRRLSRVR